MSESKHTVIVTAEFNPGGKEMPEFKTYPAKANEIIIAHGGSVTTRYGVEQNAGDGPTPHVILHIEFPSKEKAVEAFSGEAYQSIVPLRKVAVKTMNILITK